MRSSLSFMCFGVLFALLLSACGVPTQAQSGQLSELPTAPPAPTYAPVAEPKVPAAPNSDAAPANGLYTDGFDGAKAATNWEVFDLDFISLEHSQWEVRDQRLVQVSGPDGLPVVAPTGYVTGDTNWADYSVQADAYPQTTSQMGVVGRYSDKGFYVLTVLPNGTPTASVFLQRYDAATGDFIPLAKTTYGLTMNTWYTLKITFAGGSIRGSINGQEVLQATDSSFVSGKAGVYGYAEGGLLFDNFIVQR